MFFFFVLIVDVMYMFFFFRFSFFCLVVGHQVSTSVTTSSFFAIEIHQILIY